MALDVANVVAAFSEEQVEQISGLSKRRLRYWAKTDFFKPSFTEGSGRLPYSKFYSFKDIIALRTLETLRDEKNVPLQHLRKVAEHLSHLKDDLWTRTTLYVIDRKVIFVDPDTEMAQEIVSGQHVLKLSLDDVIRETNSKIVEFRRRPKDSIGKVERRRSVVRNAWVVAGTRIPVGAVKRLSEDGFSIEQIIAEYPDLTPADVDAALSHTNDKAA